MKRITLTGLTRTNKPARVGTDVVVFEDADHKIGIKRLGDKVIELTTAKGVYKLQKHNTHNYFGGVCNGTRVHVSLKAVVGELRIH